MSKTEKEDAPIAPLPPAVKAYLEDLDPRQLAKMGLAAIQRGALAAAKAARFSPLVKDEGYAERHAIERSVWAWFEKQTG